MTNSTLSDAAREDFIRDTGLLMEAAMKRAEVSHNPKDKAEARRLLGIQNTAIAERSPEQQARMTAEIERRISEGVDYFAVCGARDGQELRNKRLVA